jgi:hypothetical protein
LTNNFVTHCLIKFWIKISNIHITCKHVISSNSLPLAILGVGFNSKLIAAHFA